MSQQLANAMRLQASRVMSVLAKPRFGFVDAYNPANNTAKVKLSDASATITGWLPVQSMYLGNGWGAVIPLTPGDQVLVLFGMNDQDSGVIVARIYDQQHAVPTDPAGARAATGEFLLVHETGSTIKLQADGKILIHATAEIDVGNVLGTLLPLLTNAAATVYNGHTHPANGQPPTQKMTAAHQTTVLKAN